MANERGNRPGQFGAKKFVKTGYVQLVNLLITNSKVRTVKCKIRGTRLCYRTTKMSSFFFTDFHLFLPESLSIKDFVNARFHRRKRKTQKKVIWNFDKKVVFQRKKESAVRDIYLIISSL